MVRHSGGQGFEFAGLLGFYGGAALIAVALLARPSDVVAD